MLEISKKFKGKTANGRNTNGFLTNLLVEVVTENYRQSIFEAIEMSGNSLLDPPLRANERVISGLFASAMARVAPRSRTEVRIDRPDWNSYQDKDMPDDDAKTSKAGRADYLAWYDDSVFGVELKAASMNCESPKRTAPVSNRWKKGINQAKETQNHLMRLHKEDSNRYPRPISLALMVVIGRRRVKNSALIGNEIKNMAKGFIKSLDDLSPKPSFQAIYTFPENLRDLAPRKKGRVKTEDDSIVYTPFIAFIAQAAVNTSGRS